MLPYAQSGHSPAGNSQLHFGGRNASAEGAKVSAGRGNPESIVHHVQGGLVRSVHGGGRGSRAAAGAEGACAERGAARAAAAGSRGRGGARSFLSRCCLRRSGQGEPGDWNSNSCCATALRNSGSCRAALLQNTNSCCTTSLHNVNCSLVTTQLPRYVIPERLSRGVTS